jgi:hypothetical protein
METFFGVLCGFHMRVPLWDEHLACNPRIITMSGSSYFNWQTEEDMRSGGDQFAAPLGGAGTLFDDHPIVV